MNYLILSLSYYLILLSYRILSYLTLSLVDGDEEEVTDFEEQVDWFLLESGNKLATHFAIDFCFFNILIPERFHWY